MLKRIITAYGVMSFLVSSGISYSMGYRISQDAPTVPREHRPTQRVEPVNRIITRAVRMFALSMVLPPIVFVIRPNQGIGFSLGATWFIILGMLVIDRNGFG